MTVKKVRRFFKMDSLKEIEEQEKKLKEQTAKKLKRLKARHLKILAENAEKYQKEAEAYQKEAESYKKKLDFLVDFPSEKTDFIDMDFDDFVRFWRNQKRIFNEMKNRVNQSKNKNRN